MTMNKIENRKSKIGGSRAFTLVELLVVISVMALLAGFTIPVLKSVKRQQYLKTTRAELDQIQTALENYKAQCGSYPAGNPLNPLCNQLYYELSGTARVSGANVTPVVYKTLDGSAQIDGNQLTAFFGVGGLVNCTKGGGEDATVAKNFLSGLRANRIGTCTSVGNTVNVLVASVGGPDQSYLNWLSFNGGLSGNPFHYTYPGVNNPKSYDLWIDLSISGQTNRLSNWKSQVQILP